jgi:hypothetical protein
MSALVVVVVSVALVTAGCGTESPSRDDPTAKATQVTAGGPSKPPPKLDIDGPPPAWVHTGDDAVWLAYSTYCWKTACADYVETRCGERRQPGATVLFHLDFNPKIGVACARRARESLRSPSSRSRAGVGMRATSSASVRARL